MCDRNHSGHGPLPAGLSFFLVGLMSLLWEPNVHAQPAPLPDPSGNNKVRFLSFHVSGGSGETALRINLVSLHHVLPPYTGGVSVPFNLFEGESIWVGPPSTYFESSASGVPFKSAITQCIPYYYDWSTVGLLHVRGSAIVPSSIYEVENVSAACKGHESSAACSTGGPNVSGALEIRTNRWGDCETPYNPPTPVAQPDFGDIAALINKFRGIAGALIKARAIMSSSNIFGEITNVTMSVDLGFSHIASCVDAFRGLAYPAKMGKCAGTPSPPATGACTLDADCTGNNGVPPCQLFCNQAEAVFQIDCCEPGACFLQNGTCVADVSLVECIDLDGSSCGPGTLCQPGTCAGQPKCKFTATSNGTPLDECPANECTVKPGNVLCSVLTCDPDALIRTDCPSIGNHRVEYKCPTKGRCSVAASSDGCMACP